MNMLEAAAKYPEVLFKYRAGKAHLWTIRKRQV